MVNDKNGAPVKAIEPLVAVPDAIIAPTYPGRRSRGFLFAREVRYWHLAGIAGRRSMSAFGVKQTSRGPIAMSAFDPFRTSGLISVCVRFLPFLTGHPIAKC